MFNVRYSLEKSIGYKPPKLLPFLLIISHMSVLRKPYSCHVHCRLRHDTISSIRNACCKSVGLHAELDGQYVEHE